MSVFRYKSVGVSLANLQTTVPGSIVLGTYSPSAFIDITASATFKADLDEQMSRYGYQYNSTDPTNAYPLSGLRQSVFAEVSVDTSTTVTSPTFTTLLTTSITLSTTPILLVFVSWAAIRNNPGNNLFRLVIDGTVKKGASSHGHGGGVPNASGAIMYRMTGLIAGAHTVAVEWSQDTTGTVSINPVSDPNAQHASLLLLEIGS